MTEDKTNEKQIVNKKNGMSANPENNLVSEHNTLVYSKYKLSLFQQKLILLIASHIHPDDKEFKEYQFHVNDIIEGLGLKRNNKYYNLIMKTTEELMDKPALRIIEQNPKTGKPKKVLAHWFNTLEYLGDGVINIQFHKKLKPYLLNLRESGNFTSFRLVNVLKLKSSYHIRLYEILRSHLWKKGDKPIDLDLKELKMMLGVEEDKYNTYGHFNSRVLKKAQEELEKYTDIYFEYDSIKEARKVVGINFYVYNKKSKEVDKPNVIEEIKEEKTIELDIETKIKIDTLKSVIIYNLKEKDYIALLDAAEGDAGKVIQQYYLIKQTYIEKGKDIGNLTGLLIKAIKGGYDEVAVSSERTHQAPKTKFHNFNQRTSDYTPEELERMLEEKQKKRFK